ncbi:MAG TPA: hypothetical protein VNZ53_48065 [Steroidobacteraceae bacterium]|nr:hypothetical protein [Steroidobacteraceae bacterium]
MLSRFPAMPSAGARTLFLVGAIVTTAILLWMYQWRLGNDRHGLSTIFFVLFVYNDYPGTVCALLILIGALFGSRCLPVRRVLQWPGDHPLVIAVITALLLALGTLVVYHNHPLSMDEYAAYFQSRVFAAGQLHGRFPPPLLDWLIPRGFQDYFLNVSRATGSVAETYWPGFALLLTPFTWAGVPWLCNPVISALTLLVIHRLALELFDDREAAGFALLLTIASPVFFANGISYYSMPAHLLANSVFALLLVRPTPLRAAAAGVVGSLALALHNPVPHMLFAAPWLVWIVTRQSGTRLLASLIAGYVPLCVLLGLGWFLFSGQLLREGMVPAASVAPIASWNRLQGMIAIFSLPDAAVVLARLIGIAKTWVWAVPGLMILAAAGAVRWHQHALCRLFTASAVLTLLGYFLVPVDQGHGWGYRYFHSAWMALPLLATAALFRPARTSHESNPPARLFADSETKGFVAACILLSLVFGIGFRAWQLQDFVARDVSQMPQYKGTERRVVILDSRSSFYGADLVQNDPWLRGNELRMYSHGAAADQQMMAQYYPELHRVYADRYGTVWSL